MGQCFAPSARCGHVTKTRPIQALHLSDHSQWFKDGRQGNPMKVNPRTSFGIDENELSSGIVDSKDAISLELLGTTTHRGTANKERKATVKNAVGEMMHFGYIIWAPGPSQTFKLLSLGGQ